MADRVARRLRGPDHRRARPRRRHPRGRHARRHPPPGGRPMSHRPTHRHADEHRGVRTSEALLVEPSALSPDPARARRPCCARASSSIFLVLVAVIVVATIKNTSFLFSGDGWRNFLLNPSILLLLAVGQARRHHHPQRRPVRRLGDGADGLPHRPAVHRPARASRSSRCFVVVPARSARVLGLVNGVLVAFFKRARAGHHARHALHLPRHHAHLGRQRPDQRRRPAPRLPRSSAPSAVLDHPGAHDRRARRPGGRRLLPLHRPRWPRALRDRLRPGRRGPLRPARTPPRARARSS